MQPLWNPYKTPPYCTRKEKFALCTNIIDKWRSECEERRTSSSGEELSTSCISQVVENLEGIYGGKVRAALLKRSRIRSELISSGMYSIVTGEVENLATWE